MFVQRKTPRAEKQNRKQSGKHAEIRTPLVHGGPESLLEQHRELRGGNGDRNVDKKRNCSEGGEKANNQQSAAHAFHGSPQTAR